jgi:transposase
MMGRHEKQNELWCEPVSLAKRIPQDHPLRQLNRVLDLEFVRHETRRFYGNKGNVSVDPVIIMKMMILLFWDNVRSERELMKIIPLRIDYLWFLGYGLDDEVPNHSVLSKARARWGQKVFEELFSRTVRQCLDAGLIGGDKLHADSSLVRADASLNSVVRITVEKLDQSESGEDEESSGRGKPPANKQVRSTTDPDSTVVRHRQGKSQPSYKNHRVLDDQCGVITSTKTTTGIRNEAAELIELVDRTMEAVGKKPRAVVADTMYGRIENHIELGKRKIRSHLSDLQSRQNNHRQEGIYGPEKFRYDQASDCFRCPANRKLTYHHFHQKRGYFEYRAARGVCATCRLRAKCTRDKAGRTLKRYPHQELLERARRQSAGPAARKDRIRRQWFQERNFGEAATQHGFKRSRWRGLKKQTIQDQLIASIQNLKILMRNASAALPEPSHEVLSRIHRHLSRIFLLIDPSRPSLASC